MQLENKFTIDAPIDKAWEALNNPETVAPCFPGATLTSYEGDSFAGTVKVKLGPISLTYKGKGTYVERDDDAHRVVIKADGRDSRGNGTANATVTASLQADGPDTTAVTLATDMTITGRPAQFGRGVISDVADKIIGQFSSCVAQKLAPAQEAATTGAVATEGATPAAPAESATVPAAAASAGSAGSTNGSAAAAAATATETDAALGNMPTSETVAPASASSLSATPATAATAPERGTAQGAPKPATASGPVKSEIDAIDLLDTAGAPVIKRLAPVLGGALLLLIVLLIRRSRS